MIHTLLLRFAAPQQSWGSHDAKFEERKTLSYPTKSAVTGFVQCALGRGRNAYNEDLKKLLVGVRIDQHGVMGEDFQASEVIDEPNARLQNKYYLQDSLFLVGLESSNIKLLNEISDAIKNTKWQLYLGRKCFPPTGEIVIGIRSKPLLDALKEEPWLASEYKQKEIMGRNLSSDYYLQIFVETKNREGALIKDMPYSRGKKCRTFGWRGIKDCGKFPIKTSANISNGADIDFFDCI